MIFGARPAPVIDTPPDDVEWRTVRARNAGPVLRAWRAEADCQVETRGGVLNAEGGRDYVVVYEPGNRGVVRGDVFDRTYEQVGSGLYRKRAGVTYRYFTSDRTLVIQTEEGPHKAKPGDWIMEGVSGELWPIPRAEAEEKYESV